MFKQFRYVICVVILVLLDEYGIRASIRIRLGNAEKIGLCLSHWDGQSLSIISVNVLVAW